MFATTGLLKDISCPYFLFGLCERPYCHFKHSRHEESKARLEAEKAVASNKDAEDAYKPPTSSLQRTLQDIENSILSEKRKLGSQDSLQNKERKQQKTYALKNKPTGTPEYNPTPLEELKKKKLEVKLGRSVGKYELALLEEPGTDSEYDPASNYSTGSKSTQVIGKVSDGNLPADDTAVPDYAKVLPGNKRHAEDEAADESPLTKIPKFVSVEYTPAVNDSIEYSDEEPLGNKQDWFSDEASDKGSESDKLSDSGNDRVKDESHKTYLFEKTEKNSMEMDISQVLPIEFTPEGFVKTVPIDARTDTVKELKKEDSTNSRDICNQDLESKSKRNATESKDKGSSGDNIFSLFKEEFDTALENAGVVVKEDSKENGEAAVVPKTSETDEKSSRVPNTCEKSNKKHSSKSKLHHKNVKHSSSKYKSPDSHEKSHSHRHHNRVSGSRRHSTDRSDSRESKSESHKTNGAISEKHGHSSAKSHDSSKHKSSSREKDSSTKHKDNLSSKHKNSSSGSRSKNSSKHDRSSKSNKHHSEHKHMSEKQSSSGSKISSHSSKDKQSISGNKSGETRSTKTANGEERKSGKKKKQIVNLDVDLFGVESDFDTGVERQNGCDDDDLSDLEKYFEDEDPFEECQRIFNESGNLPSTSNEAARKKLKKKMVEESMPPPATVGKKRVALKQGDPEAVRKKIADKPTPKPSPAQVMMNRYKMMQEQALQEERDNKEKIKAKVREISHQNAEKAASTAGPSQPNLASATATFSSYIASKNKKTSAITVAKGAKRKAHAPTVPIEKLKRPTVEVSSSSKVATNIRQRYLNQFIDECLKFCPSEEEAYRRGKEEEEAVYKRSSNRKIYLNFAVNTIKRLRTEADQQKSQKSPSPGLKKLSHAALLDGAGATKATYTVHRSGGAVKLQEENFTGAELYKRLQPYVLTEDQLKENNFPRPDPAQGGTAVFYGEEMNSQKSTCIIKGYEKLCVRCGKIFEVYPNGKYPLKEECVYHWGKAWKKRVAGSIETRYTCCQGDLASEGCQVAKLHVHETNKKENKSGFMKTIPSSPAIDGDYGVYALDCEMVYTTMGVELARVTVVGADEEPVYESLVLPDNPIIDLNTRFSGITEEDMEDITTSPRDVQAVLLSLFTAQTILIGHSLESDLSALKLIHSTVVDTSVAFPHRLGKPYKRALKNLMAEFLKKIIQDDVGGHDSLEDAVACLQLMQYKLKEDARKEGRRLSS